MKLWLFTNEIDRAHKHKYKHMPYKDPEARKAHRRLRNIEERNNTRKSECKRKNIPYDLTHEYLLMLKEQTPRCCITGIELDYATCTRVSREDNKAELDRIDASAGYVRGNVRWISHKANRQKSDTTTQDLIALLADRLRLTPQEIEARLADVIEARDIVEETEETAHYEG